MRKAPCIFGLLALCTTLILMSSCSFFQSHPEIVKESQQIEEEVVDEVAVEVKQEIAKEVEPYAQKASVTGPTAAYK